MVKHTVLVSMGSEQRYKPKKPFDFLTLYTTAILLTAAHIQYACCCMHNALLQMHVIIITQSHWPKTLQCVSIAISYTLSMIEIS